MISYKQNTAEKGAVVPLRFAEIMERICLVVMFVSGFASYGIWKHWPEEKVPKPPFGLSGYLKLIFGGLFILSGIGELIFGLIGMA